MIKIALLDATNNPFVLELDTPNSLLSQTTVLTVPDRFQECFNFKNLDDKYVDQTKGLISAFIERWAHCKPYHQDQYAPTMGNAILALQRLLDYANRFPTGYWQIQKDR